MLRREGSGRRTGRAIAGAIVQTVNARELHTFLGNCDHFSTWIQDRKEQYGFVENQDFVTYSGISEKGRPPKEYAISIDMAKELSMVERTAKGKEARQYFIDCERRAITAAHGGVFSPPPMRRYCSAPGTRTRRFAKMRKGAIA